MAEATVSESALKGAPGPFQHPLAMRVRLLLSEVFWRVRARTVRNPAFPEKVRSILFVCKGNICRSPFAAARARDLLEIAGAPDIRCASAGIVPSGDGACPPDAVAAATVYELSLGQHRPVPLTQELVEAHDIVVVMEAGHLAQLRSRWARQRPRFFLLPLLEPGHGDARTASERLNILDPFGGGRAEFDRCYRRIDLGLHALLRRIASEPLRSPR